MEKKKDLKVFISHKNSTCGECNEELGRSAWITLEEKKGALCLSCSDIDHLVFLPSGDAALTRRSKKYSTLSAVVLRFSKARRRYERQGLLVEEKAVAQAEKECLDDSEARARKRERAAEKRVILDKKYVNNFAESVRELFPKCPPKREKIIAEHACLKYSDRIGRTASAKGLSKETIFLAVYAHIRHAETDYHAYLAKGYERREARMMIKGEVDDIFEKWKTP